MTQADAVLSVALKGQQNDPSGESAL